MNTQENPPSFVETYAHAIKIIDNWPNRVIRFSNASNSWHQPTVSWDQYSMNALNNKDIFKLKLAKKFVPFSKSDIKSNMWFGYNDLWRKAVAKDDDGIYVIGKDNNATTLNRITWHDLQRYWVYSLDGEEKEYWCEKGIEVEPE